MSRAFGVQKRSKPVTEALQSRNQIRRAFWKPFGAVPRPILEAFLKSPCDRMMCKSEKRGKVRIFKNTSVFTVRLHSGLVDKTRAKRARN